MSGVWFGEEFRHPSILAQWFVQHEHQIVQRTVPITYQSCHQTSNTRSLTPISHSLLPSQSFPASHEDGVPVVSPHVSLLPPSQSLSEEKKEVPSSEMRPLLIQRTSTQEHALVRTIKLYESEAKWWLSSACHQSLACRPVANLPVIKDGLVTFNGRTVRGFRNFFYLQKLPDGRAVGNANVCAKIIASRKPLPPLLPKKTNLSEEQCRKHVIETFTKIWFVVHYTVDEGNEEDEQDEEELVCWPDLCTANKNALRTLKEFVSDLFVYLSADDSKLKNFLLLTLIRATSTAPFLV